MHEKQKQNNKHVKRQSNHKTRLRDYPYIGTIQVRLNYERKYKIPW